MTTLILFRRPDGSGVVRVFLGGRLVGQVPIARDQIDGYLATRRTTEEGRSDG